MKKPRLRGSIASPIIGCWCSRPFPATAAHSATLGITGMAGLILVGILLLSTIEDTFNDIWGAPRRRSWFTRLVQYWTTISLGPIVVFVIIAQIGSTFSPAARNLGSFAFS